MRICLAKELRSRSCVYLRQPQIIARCGRLINCWHLRQPQITARCGRLNNLRVPEATTDLRLPNFRYLRQQQICGRLISRSYLRQQLICGRPVISYT